jgi:hypothetical protein
MLLVVLNDTPWFYESGRPVDAFASLCQLPSSDRSMIPPAPLPPLMRPSFLLYSKLFAHGWHACCLQRITNPRNLKHDPGYNNRKLRLYILKYSCCYQQLAFSNKFLHRIFIELFIFKWSLNIYIYIYVDSIGFWRWCITQNCWGFGLYL